MQKFSLLNFSATFPICRNGLMPKKVHLEFALGNAIPKEGNDKVDYILPKFNSCLSVG